MTGARWAWIDGAATALGVAVAMLALGAARGTPLDDVVGGWFFAGVALMMAGGVVSAVRRRPAHGLAARWRRRHAPAAPSARNAWLDRWITPDNAWFVAGALLVVASLAGAALAP